MSRPEVYDEMFNFAKQYIQEKSMYPVKVKKEAPHAIENTCLVVIPKCKVLLKGETLKKGEQEFKLIFNIEIYSTDITVERRKVARQSVIYELQNLVYQVFGEHYGMKITSDLEVPNIDTNLIRENIRFEATINENKIIYRR